MPRKYFRRYLPSHQSVRENRWLRVFGTLLHHHNLWHLNRRSVSGGVAAGLFAGLVPGPLQMITGAILSLLFKVNLPVALLTTLYTNPLTIVPLYLIAYRIGTLALGENGAQVTPFDDSAGFLASIPALIDWVAGMGKPLALGLVLLALGLALAGYLATRWAWRLHVLWEWRRRRQRHAAARRTP